MRKLLFGLLIVCSSVNVHGEECVVLLHGLARTSASMDKLDAALTSAGYAVVNHPYASRKNNIQTLAAEEVPIALAQCANAEKVHFVTHSLGGIVLRQYLSTNSIEGLGRTVMLAPPNQGSQVVDKLKFWPGYKLLNGPAGMQLGTDAQSLPPLLGPANFELGVIAGTRSINWILSTLLPGTDDGKVTVENTKLEGMADHISIAASHPFIMRDARAIHQVLFFLSHGRFQQEAKPQKG